MSGGHSSGELAVSGIDAGPSGAARDAGNQMVKSSQCPREVQLPGKNVHFDDETWHALELLARDRKQKFQDLADEAFFDLLKKHGRQPTKEA
jgi:hypothetical protein